MNDNPTQDAVTVVMQILSVPNAGAPRSPYVLAVEILHALRVSGYLKPAGE